LLIQSDAAALEWRCAAFLSQDKTALAEIWNNVDQHTDNQTRFGLPDRLTAKKFVFRLIYGGSAYSYANDPDFIPTGRSEKFWQGVIDEFYTKYSGLHRWHTKLVQEATLTGKVLLPTGREYEFTPVKKNGQWVWPRTTILNYPVQGLGADIMAIGRVSLYNRLKALNLPNIKLVNTVHDSIIIDATEDHVDMLVKLNHKVFENIPANFQKLFGVEFNVPMKCEVQVGSNWKEMEIVS
jgi:DNA polymerase I-like protein with 3'-5' exonuclease and polymerase domains